MFSYISGKLMERTPAEAVIEAGGVGYSLLIPLSTYSALPEVGETVALKVHLQIREDAWQLYGFAVQEEKNVFKLLIGISGVGPKLAIAVLSGIGIENFKKAVYTQDVAALKAVSGIGKKTAERIIVELKEKVSCDEDYVAIGNDNFFSGTGSCETTVSQDALNALVALGYKKSEAEKALIKVMPKTEGEQISVEELIRKSLTFV